MKNYRLYSHMTPDEARQFKNWQLRTIIVTMIGYSLFYFVRKNFSVAMPGINTELGISKVDLGLFLTLNGIIYGVSRFVNGIFADRLNARFYMATGLMLCAIANFAFGYGVDIAALITGETSGMHFTNTLILFMGILWTINGIMQGSGFPPCARLLTHWIHPSELATKMSLWNSSHSIGAALVVVLCGNIMGIFGAGENHVGAWKWCFWIPAAIAFTGSVFLFIFLRDTPSSIGLPELETKHRNEEKEIQKNEEKQKKNERNSFLRKKVFCNPLIWILGIANFFVYVVRFSMLDWGPTLLNQSKLVEVNQSSWMVAAFEVAGIIGTLLAGWATDRYLKGRAHRTCVFCMLGTMVFAFLFWQLSPSAPAWMFFALLCPMGFFIYGPQALIGIAAANQATKKAAATANGITGIFGYASTTVSGIGFGYVADHYGWDLAYIAIIVMALIGMGIFLLMWNAKADGYEE